MKRCPQCSFLYLDSDELCDLDQTPLIADDTGTGVDVFEHPERKVGKLSLTAAVYQRKLNLKILSAAIAAGLIIGLTLLLGYQRMSSTLQASQAPATSPTPASPAYRARPVARNGDEVIAKAALALQESPPLAPSDDTIPSAKPALTAKTHLVTRADSARLRLSSKPVSTGDLASPDRGPVTIRLANGSSLEADEVWRTKAGVWYRRKGIVTLLRPNRLRSISK